MRTNPLNTSNRQARGLPVNLGVKQELTYEQCEKMVKAILEYRNNKLTNKKPPALHSADFNNFMDQVIRLRSQHISRRLALGELSFALNYLRGEKVSIVLDQSTDRDASGNMRLDRFLKHFFGMTSKTVPDDIKTVVNDLIKDWDF